MTSQFTINKLRETFSRFGLVDTIVSDNARQFTSDEFQLFTKINNIQHILTAPGHPTTHGQAENFANTLKKWINANLKNAKSNNFDVILCRFLIDYRNAKIMFGRELKTRFSLLKPPVIRGNLISSKEKNIKNHKGKRNLQLEIDRKVYICDYLDPNKPSWAPATIKEKFGSRLYACVITHNGREIKRHLNQIRETFVQIGSDQTTSTNEQQNDEQEGDTVDANPPNLPTVDAQPEEDDDDDEVNSPETPPPIERPSHEYAQRTREVISTQYRNRVA